MKKFIIGSFIFYSLMFFAQVKIPTDFKFVTPFCEAENQYIVFSPKGEDKSLMLGVPYFDESAGYSFRLIGSLEEKNGKLAFVPTDTNGTITARWQNIDLKVAVLSDERIKEFALQNPPDFLKYYKSNKNPNALLVDKLSFMNGENLSNLALPKLEQLKKENYKSAKFYFELTFAYNALEQFSKAEETATEAEKNNFSDELMIKEKHYAILHQNKTQAAADYLENNFKNFKTQSYKSECVLNQMITFYNQKDFQNTEKWIGVYKKEIGQDQYKSYVDNIENKIKIDSKK